MVKFLWETKERFRLSRATGRKAQKKTKKNKNKKQTQKKTPKTKKNQTKNWKKPPCLEKKASSKDSICR